MEGTQCEFQGVSPGRLSQAKLYGFGLIPNQDDRPLNMPSKVFQAIQQFLSINGTIKMSFVNLARNRQCGHRRSFTSIATVSFQLRGLTFGCPGETHWFHVRDPKLIFKDDFCAALLCLFLSLANPVQPGQDQFFITLNCARIWLLDTPAHSVQQTADVVLMIENPKFLFDHLLHARLCPLFCWKACASASCFSFSANFCLSAWLNRGGLPLA